MNTKDGQLVTKGYLPNFLNEGHNDERNRNEADCNTRE